MRAFDIIRQKRRFEMFSERTKDAVLEVNSFFGKYNMHYEEKIKKRFIYYDTPNFDLQKSSIVLFKTIIGNFCELNMRTEKTSSTLIYTVRTNYKQFSTPARPLDNPFKHKDFLINSFKEMFLSGLNFDPEFLLQKLRPMYVIDTVSTEYRSMNLTGLKITYSFDKDVYTNLFDNIKVNANILTIYQHSPENTNADFEDLISKLSRYCKELTSTSETKIMIARRLTHEKLMHPKPQPKQQPTASAKKKKK